MLCFWDVAPKPGSRGRRAVRADVGGDLVELGLELLAGNGGRHLARQADGLGSLESDRYPISSRASHRSVVACQERPFGRARIADWGDVQEA